MAVPNATRHTSGDALVRVALGDVAGGTLQPSQELAEVAASKPSIVNPPESLYEEVDDSGRSERGCRGRSVWHFVLSHYPARDTALS